MGYWGDKMSHECLLSEPSNFDLYLFLVSLYVIFNSSSDKVFSSLVYMGCVWDVVPLVIEIATVSLKSYLQTVYLAIAFISERCKFVWQQTRLDRPQ